MATPFPLPNLDTSASYFHRAQPTRIKVGLEYRDPGGEGFVERFEHTPEIYQEMELVERSH